MPATAPITALRRWLGPLGRYRPGLLRRDMADGFHNCDPWTLPRWARVPQWRSPEERLLESLELRGKVVYDIGAFTGTYSLFFSQRVGAAGRVVAFEPRAASFALLLRNLRRNQVANVLPLRLALGAEHGSAAIYMLPGMPTTASLAADARTPLRRHAGESQIERLDDLLLAASLPAPDFLKIDVEGFELEVLRGGVATLAEHRPELLVEVHGAGGALKRERTRKIAELLEPIGYSIRHTESNAWLSAGTAEQRGGGHLHARAA